MVSVLKNDLVIKSNTLIEACFNLSLTEYRILQIAFTELAEYESDKGLFHTREFKVYAQDYSKIFNIDESNAYGLLREASERMFNRYLLMTVFIKNPILLSPLNQDGCKKLVMQIHRAILNFN